ncbi:phosphatidate cytidylyltransferase [Dinghuibacter silviterrae]|uniref:Phosphatidate cytidylyltransferase n=1 Tax=Dinghuibacter silviterrae TaxID=1539049 RepID=A0A4R8DQB8_9BACT|nr:phosphatidate cytidylyltransferase [Dinghuibacter silviterrae]TDW99975.1 phosphatidate cytidylyltransferase [Dinghuibacter silviterrae]
MALNVATFKTRTLSAIIFVVVMVGGLLWNRTSFFALFTLIHFGCWYEFLLLMKAIDPDFKKIHKTWAWGFPLLGWGGMWWAFRGIPDAMEGLAWAGYVGDAVMGAGVLLIAAGAVLKPEKTGKNLWYALAGLAYISLPWFLMILLYGMGDSLLSMTRLLGGTPTLFQRIAYPVALPCILIFSIWINDTMAYIVGSFIGRTPFSKISPKKTWEGTAGGALLCVGAMTLLGHFVGIYQLGVWIGISAIAAVVGTAGDLLESRLKRLAGVKDSGSILPGHGGFLDRFDSLLLATPVTYAFFILLSIL